MAYATTDEVASYLGVTIDGSSTPSATEVSAYLDEATAWIDHITKTSYSSTTVENKIIDFTSDTTVTSAASFDSTSALNIPAPVDRIQLPDKDVVSLISCEFNSAPYTSAPEWVSQDIGYGQDVILINDYIQVLSPTARPRAQIGSVRATYTKGRSSVPAHVRAICVYMTSLRVMEGAQSNSLTEAGGDIRVGDLEIDEPSGFSTSFIKQTQSSLDKQLDKLGTHNTYLI